MEDYSGMCWSYFLKAKSETAEIIPKLMMQMLTKGLQPKYIRCDNAGENTKADKLCQSLGLGITFEYTARNTPQQNGQVERSFATLYGKMRAMMRSAKMTEAEKERYKDTGLKQRQPQQRSTT